jgi:hypothetical protein
VVAIVVDVGVAITWFAARPAEFEQISGVVKAAWAGFLALTAAFGIRMRTKRERSWAHVFGLPPVQALVGTFTLFTFGALGVSWLSTGSAHLVNMTPPDSLSDVSFTIRFAPTNQDGGATTFQVRGLGSWKHRIPRGDYWVVVAFDNHEPDSVTTHVGLWSGLFSSIPVNVNPRVAVRTGTIVINPDPRGTDVVVRRVEGNDTVFRDVWRGPDAFRVPTAPGRYWLIGRALGRIPDSLNVEVAADVEVDRPLRLRVESLTGWLIVDVTPSRLDISVDGRSTGLLTPDSLRLKPGRYAVVVRGRRSSQLTDRFGYLETFDARVQPNSRARLEGQVGLQPLPQLRFLDPGGGSARYFLLLDGQERELSADERLGGVFLLPGPYTLIRRAGTEETRRTVTIESDITISFER